MNPHSPNDRDLPAEVDFSKGVRGLHHIPPGSKILMPVSIEQSVWQHYAEEAERKGVELSVLVTEVLKRAI